LLSTINQRWVVILKTSSVKNMIDNSCVDIIKQLKKKASEAYDKAVAAAQSGASNS
jgi:hypothetical protein